jgi:hypothetical protein
VLASVLGKVGGRRDDGGRGKTHLRLDLLPLMVVEVAAAGRCAFPAFLVTRVTPPLSPSAGAMPTACISHQYVIPIQYPCLSSSLDPRRRPRSRNVRAYLGVGKAGVLENSS